VAKEPGHRGEHEISRKTIACGNAGLFRCLVVTNARVYYTTRAAAGASAPGIPHALTGRTILSKLGRFASRDREIVSTRHCEERMRRSNPAFCRAAPKLDRFAGNDGYNGLR
jgi:hypothetical protein